MKAKDYINELSKFRSKEREDVVGKSFKGNDGLTKPFGVRFGDVFRTAKKYIDLNLVEINKLLDSEYYEIRMGAVSIMDFQAKNKKTSNEQKRELFNLYLNRHDRLNSWGFVDRGANSIIGEYLMDKPRAILYKLAISDNIWERRTAIVCTHAFIKKGQLNDTFKIAEILINDSEELINKAVGSWIREAGKKDGNKLKRFLDKYATSMPRVTLRYALEKFDKVTKEYYMKLDKNTNSKSK